MIYLMGIAMWANPFLLLAVWVNRLKPFRNDGIRIRLGWISLALATVGFVAFIGGMSFGGEAGTPAFDHWFVRWFWVCSAISILVLVTGVFGEGKMSGLWCYLLF